LIPSKEIIGGRDSKNHAPGCLTELGHLLGESSKKKTTKRAHGKTSYPGLICLKEKAGDADDGVYTA